MKQHLASLSILNLDRNKNASLINKVLSKHSLIIMSRLGLNVQKNCTKNCQTLITINVLATRAEIKSLSDDLKKIKGINVKNVLF